MPNKSKNFYYNSRRKTMFKLNSWNENEKYSASKVAQNVISTACGSDVVASACGSDVNTACGSDVVASACGSDVSTACGSDITTACGSDRF